MLRSLFLTSALLLAAAARAAEPAPALASVTFSGDQSALEQLDRDVSAAGSDATKLTALEKRLLELLRHKDGTFAARQAVAQRLGTVLSLGTPKAKADDYKPLGAMLLDERDANVARLALEPVPGVVVDGLFLAALAKSTGTTRLGLIDSLGRRRVASAVNPLAALLDKSDDPTFIAAVKSLGAIGTTEAISALRAAPKRLPAAGFRGVTTPAIAVAEAKLVAAARLEPAAASSLLREVSTEAQLPAHVQAAAIRAALPLDPAGAGQQIAEILGRDDWTFKQVALEAIAHSTAANLVATLTAKLSGWDAPTQAGVIAALGRRADPAAGAAFVTATAHADAEVRAAAITALGNLPGDRARTTLLAKIAAGSNNEDAKLARQSLAQLKGPDVNAAILAGAERGEPALRTAYLEQFALRNLTEGIPFLLKLRTDTDAAIRGAAVGALGEIAPPSEQRALIEWAVGAKDEAEQSRALRSLVNVTLRNRAADERGRAVYEAIEKAAPDDALRLLPALSRLGGANSAACAARLALRDNRAVADAAVAALGRWPDESGLRSLADVAQKANLPEVRAAALEAALKTFEKNREPWSASASTVVAALFDAATDVPARQRLVALLNRANDKPALQLANRLKTDAALAATATEAAEIIAANLAGRPTLRTSTVPENAKNMIDGKTSTRWNAPTAGEEWIEVGYKTSRPIHRITLDQTSRGSEFPESYEVYVTDDARAPGTARVTGKGRQNKTVIDLPAGTRGRYVIIKNVAERKESQWSVCELFVD